MRVYVAASSREIPRARAVMAALREARMIVTHDWTGHVEASIAMGTPEHMLDDRLAWACAHDDLAGVREAEALVLLAPTETAKGAWYECGYADALNIPIVVAHDDVAKRRQSIFTRRASRLCSDAEIVDALRSIGGGL